MTDSAAALLLRGPFQTRTGYGLHTRSLARALLRQRIPLELEDIPRFSPDSYPPDALDPELLALSGHQHARRAVHVSLPTTSRPVVGCFNLLVSMFEGSSIPPVWLAAAL